MSKFPVEVVERSPLVAMFTAPNAGPKTLDGTHTYIVGSNEAYVIDPGPLKLQYQQSLYRWVRDQGLSIRGILLTHRHPDHAPGTSELRKWLNVPVFSFSREGLEGIERSALCKLRDGMWLDVDGDSLRVIETPGHTADHLGFWLEKARIFFAGDVILGHGTTLIDPLEGDMALYLQSLERIRSLKPRVIAPGHGPVIWEPEGKIDEYVRHRQEREQQLLKALREERGTSRDLVLRVYTDVDPKLYALALASVEAQLLKLKAEGKVRSTGLLYEVSESDT